MQQQQEKDPQKKDPQEQALQLVKEASTAIQRQKSLQPRPSQILKENPHRGSNFFGYRQQMAANAITCRKISEKINVIQVITRYMTALTRPYLRVSDSESEAGFRIWHKDNQKELNQQEQEDVKSLEQFFLNCGVTSQTSEESVGSYIAKLIRDYISVDHFTSQILYSLSGDILGFCAVDSASIVPLQPLDCQRTGFNYVQILDGLEFSMFGQNEIIMSVGNPHNNIDDLRLPGTPVVLTAADLLFSHIMAEKHNTRRFREDSIPRGAFLLQNASGIQDVTALQDWFAMTMNGDQSAMPWGIPIIPSSSDKGRVEWVDFNQKNRDMEFSQLYEIGMSIITALFQVDITELGIHSAHSGRMENNQQLGRFVQAGDRSLGTILAFIELHFNQILKLITQDYYFSFTGKRQIDSQKEQAEEKHKLSTHASINEIRAAKDLDAWGDKLHPLWNLPINADVRAYLAQSDHYLTTNEQREQLGYEPIEEDWASKVPVSLALQAFQQQNGNPEEQMPEAEGQLESGEEPEEEQQELPDLTELQKSLGAQNKGTWPFQQLLLIEQRYIQKIDQLTNNIYRTFEHALGLPQILDHEIQKSLSGDEPLIWKGEVMYDPESGRPIKNKDFDKLLSAIKTYAEKHAVNPEELVLTPEIIGRIIGRAYVNGDDYEKLAALEFEKDKVQYRGYNFSDISPDLESIRKLIKPSEKELARIEYAVDNAAHLLQKASDSLIQDVRRIITGATVQQSSKRKTA